MAFHFEKITTLSLSLWECNKTVSTFSIHKQLKQFSTGELLIMCWLYTCRIFTAIDVTRVDIWTACYYRQPVPKIEVVFGKKSARSLRPINSHSLSQNQCVCKLKIQYTRVYATTLLKHWARIERQRLTSNVRRMPRAPVPYPTELLIMSRFIVHYSRFLCSVVETSDIPSPAIFNDWVLRRGVSRIKPFIEYIIE